MKWAGGKNDEPKKGTKDRAQGDKRKRDRK